MARQTRFDPEYSLIDRAHAHDRPVGLCGQAPSDHPHFAAWLVHAGIDSISVTPDAFADVRRSVAAAEAAPPPRPDTDPDSVLLHVLEAADAHTPPVPDGPHAVSL